jgi:hypothetical protein
MIFLHRLTKNLLINKVSEGYVDNFSYWGGEMVNRVVTAKDKHIKPIIFK